MPVKQKTVTTWECDFCGREYEDQYTHGEAANVRVEISGKAYNGDVGGATVTEWWCGLCVSAIREAKRVQREKYQDG